MKKKKSLKIHEFIFVVICSYGACAAATAVAAVHKKETKANTKIRSHLTNLPQTSSDRELKLIKCFILGRLRPSLLTLLHTDAAIIILLPCDERKRFFSSFLVSILSGLAYICNFRVLRIEIFLYTESHVLRLWRARVTMIKYVVQLSC